MKPISSDLVLTASTFIKLTTLSLLTLSLFFAAKHFSPSYPHPPSSTPPAAAAAISSRPPKLVVERTGIVDENGAMATDFVVGDYDPSKIESVVNASYEEGRESGNARVRVWKFGACDESKRDYVPCLDNVEAVLGLNSTGRGEEYERHCPARALDCLVPRPKGYKLRIPWPQSRDEVWFDNVPHARLAEDKGGQNWISIRDNKFIFPGGGTLFIHGADKYLDQISTMVPDVAFGHHIRVVLDIGCGVASFGAFLLQHNVTTLSIAPKDVHENQIQFALERGLPAMVAVFATRRLLYPSQAFDVIHCSRCRVNWIRDDGIWLLEVNRMLRAGGYFVWAAQPVYKHKDNLQEQWKEMEDLTSRICWELIKKEGHIAIWRKPLNNSCYLGRDPRAQPPICADDDDPDDVWYVGLKACITRLPDNGYGSNVTTWPARLHYPPDRLVSIKMDAYMSRKDIFKAELKYWSIIVDSYIRAFHLKELNVRNVMDMRAGFGGFATALYDFGIDCWVMNVIPVSGINTLPVLYDRGLLGVIHDWCEPFDTYPRTYDLLNAASLFSVEQRRCNISTIILEMDRILRPGGRVYISDTIPVIEEIQEIAKAIGWVTFKFDSGEGPHASLKLLNCEKRL